jgi:hypothetical protein
MRAILDDRHTQIGTKRHKRLHIAQMPAHMRQHQQPRAGCLGLGRQIIEIQRQIFRHLDKHRLTAHACNRAGNGCQREGIGQHRLPCRNPHRTQGTAQSIAARGHRKAILRPRQRGEFLLQQGSFRNLAFSRVIAVQPPMPQHRNRRFDPVLGNGFLLGKKPRKPFLHQAFFPSGFTSQTKAASDAATTAAAMKYATSGDWNGASSRMK